MAGTVFMTRKFPPSVGGMETLAADVWMTLDASSGPRARLIAHGGSNAGLLLWFPRAVIRVVGLILRREVDTVLTGDVVLYLLMAPVLRATRIRHATLAMGKDIVWQNSGYQRLVRTGLRKAPLVLAISSATADAAVAAGVPPERVRVVRLGVRDPRVTVDERRIARADLRARFGLDDDAVVLLTLGRLVRRKGVEWFIREVLPRLPDNAVYIVAGSGVDGPRVKEAMAELADPTRVLAVGPVSDAEKELMMRGADVFVQPNIAVAGDMEGFGLVAVEAAIRGSLVLASDLEGLKDAVDDGTTGFLVAPGDTEAWVARVRALVEDGVAREDQAAAFSLAARSRYSAQEMGRELRELLRPVTRR